MSHWFHRNKLKGTIDQKFDGKGTALKSSATKMLQDMRSTRQNLLTLFTDEVAKPEMIQVGRVFLIGLEIAMTSFFSRVHISVQNLTR